MHLFYETSFPNQSTKHVPWLAFLNNMKRKHLQESLHFVFCMQPIVSVQLFLKYQTWHAISNSPSDIEVKMNHVKVRRIQWFNDVSILQSTWFERRFITPLIHHIRVHQSGKLILMASCPKFGFRNLHFGSVIRVSCKSAWTGFHIKSSVNESPTLTSLPAVFSFYHFLQQ